MGLEKEKKRVPDMMEQTGVLLVQYVNSVAMKALSPQIILNLSTRSAGRGYRGIS